MVTWVMGQCVLRVTHDPSFFQYLERIQALSVILEGYKNNLMLIVNVHVLIYLKTHTD